MHSLKVNVTAWCALALIVQRFYENLQIESVKRDPRSASILYSKLMAFLNTRLATVNNSISTSYHI